jgi:hypothetical protein
MIIVLIYLLNFGIFGCGGEISSAPQPTTADKNPYLV